MCACVVCLSFLWGPVTVAGRRVWDLMEGSKPESLFDRSEITALSVGLFHWHA